MRILKFVGCAWCGLAVADYLCWWLVSERGGIFSLSGWVEIGQTALACLPGVALIKMSERKAKE